MHFFYGIGAFLTPIVVKSFLNSNFDFTTTSTSFNCYNIEEVKEYVKNKPYLPAQDSFSFVNGSSLVKNQELPDVLMVKTQFTSQTKYAFWILALIQLPAPIILGVFKLGAKNLSTYTDLEQNKGSGDEVGGESVSFAFSIDYLKSLFNNTPVFKMTLMVSLMVFVFEGLQVGFNLDTFI